uniref:Uncharacterized protein n=1 Tax=Oryza punctata TaxID=4537 RepID=A0A0E0JY23_ORYPU
MAMHVMVMHMQKTNGSSDDTMTCVQERTVTTGSGNAHTRSNIAEIDGARDAQIDRATEVRGLIDHDSISNFTDETFKDQSTAHHQFNSDDENLEDCMN